MLRGAVIGLGNVAAAVHLPGWVRRDDVAIVAVTDVRPARRASVASQPGLRWYDTAEELFARAPELDFVDICTPPSSHAALIRQSLARGCHVMCEKPLVAGLDELVELAERASAAGRVLHTVHNWHHAPIVRRTRELLREGAIGRVEHVSWQTLRVQPAATQDEDGGNWRLDPAVAGGGVLSDHGWHVFYIVNSWVDARPVAVTACLETRKHTRAGVEDTATVRLTFPAATAEVFLTWAAPARGNCAEVRGSAGSLRLEDDVLALRRRGEEERWTLRPALSSGSVHPDWFDPIAASFVRAVRGDRDGDADNVVEAGLCLALETAARESSRRHGAAVPVPVDPIARLRRLA
jgi:predicted dehydrogenase